MEKIFADMQANLQPEPIKFKLNIFNESTIDIETSNLETLLDVKQFHLESSYLSLFANFHFEKSGEKLNEGIEIGMMGIENNDKIDLILDNFDEKTAKFHMKKVSEILENPQMIAELFGSSKSDMNTYEKSKLNEKKDSKAINDKLIANLNEYLSNPGLKFVNEYSDKNDKESKMKLVNTFTLSNFNPPNSARAIAGDFFYIHIRVLHGVHFHLTANSQGFYVNESTSTKFNPNQNTDYPYFANLIDFLMTVDKSFKGKFNEIKATGYKCKNYEKPTLVFQKDTNKWLAAIPPLPSQEQNTSDKENLFGLDPSGMRDWNEELQNCKELPKSNHLMEINREKALITTKNDFLEAAIEGAKAIVDKKLWPLNPMDEKCQQVFVYNHIFFSFAVETPDNFSQEIGQEASPSISTTNCDLNNLKLLHKSDIPELSLINEALIDLKGNRVIAQSIIPGILSSDYKNFTFYGSLDEGKTIQYSEEFHELVKKVCETFYLETSIEFKDEEGKIFDIAGSIEVKGINGSDKRKYLIDLMRLSPRDLNYPDPEEHSTCVLRHELLNHYSNSLILEGILKGDEINNLQKEKDYEKYFKLINEEFAKAKTQSGNLKLNPNIGIVSSLEINEKTEVQKADLEKAAKYLTTKMIPQLLREILEGDSYHLADSFTIAEVFHNYGINMRYLGEVYKAVPKGYPNIKLTIEKSIIVRAMKHIFREALRETDPLILSDVIAHLLNCAFTSNKSPVKPSECKQNGTEPIDNSQKAIDLKKKKKKKKNGSKPSNGKNQENQVQTNDQTNKTHKKEEINGNCESKKISEPIKIESMLKKKLTISKPDSPFLKWTTKNLWERIQYLAKKRYNHDLPNFAESLTMNMPYMKISLLKNLCLVTGIVLQSVNYDIFVTSKGSSKRCFEPTDLVDVKPVVKHICTTSDDVANRMEIAQSLAYQKEHAKAEEQYRSTVELLKYLYGPVNKELAVCHFFLASICNSNSKPELALAHLKKATKIYESLYGCDHYLTISAYNRLGLHYYQDKDTLHKAFKYFSKCTYLGLVMGGESFPDDNFSFALSRVLLDLGKGSEAIDVIYNLLRNNKAIYGENHPINSDCYNSLANAHMEIGDSTRSFEMLEKSINILLNNEDPEERARGEKMKKMFLDNKKIFEESKKKQITDMGKMKKEIEINKMRKKIRKPEITEESTPEEIEKIEKEYYLMKRAKEIENSFRNKSRGIQPIDIAQLAALAQKNSAGKFRR